MESITVWFNEDKDLQMALNSLVQAGFDTANISIVMKDSKEYDVNQTASEDLESSREREPEDEENFFEEAYGTIWPISAEDLDTEEISIPGIGEIIFAGPLITQMDKVEFESSDENLKNRFYDALKLMNIKDQDLHSFEERIKAGKILAHILLENDRREEIAMIFSDNGGSLV